MFKIDRVFGRWEIDGVRGITGRGSSRFRLLFGIVSAVQSVAIASRYDAPLHPLPARRHAHPHSRVRRRVCETAISHGIFISFFYAPTKINSVRGHRLPTMRNQRASRKNARYAYSNKGVSNFVRYDGKSGVGESCPIVIKSVGTITYFDENVSKDIIETMKGKIERSWNG